MITTPIVILVDDREKAPYTFDGLGEVSVRRCRLDVGDYTLDGKMATVTRKSLADLYATVLDNMRRKRFSTELQHMDKMPCALVVVEEDPKLVPPPAGWSDSRSLIRRVGDLRARFQSIQWVFARGRRSAEILTCAWLLAASEQPGQ